MPYRPPLVPFETFVADPPDLPVRAPGEHGLATLARAELLGTDAAGAAFKAETTDGGSLAVAVTAAADGVIRVRLSEDPQARGRAARAVTLVRPPGCATATVTVTGPTVLVGAGPITAEVTLSPWHLRFLDSSVGGDGRELLAQDRGEDDISGRMRTLPFGRSLADGAVVAYHDSFTLRPDEHLVGLGEKFTALDKRGHRALMWNFDAFGAESDRAHKNVPFYLSSRGYGVLVDSGMPVEFDLGQSTHSCAQILVPDDLIDYYVLAGPEPAAVLDRFDALTGRPELPPKWAFGAWFSSGFAADSQAAVLDRARRLRAAGVPCDVLHLDCYWQTPGHWSDLRWDAELFPDPEGMLADLAGQGFRVCLWTNPYVSARSPAFAEGEAAGYFLRRPDGSAYVADVWHGSHPASGIVDFTNPAAGDWFAGRLRDLLRQGVDAFKTDFAEGVPADAVAANGMTGVELHNAYALMFNDLVADVTREEKGHALVWARSSYLGGQRHSAQWSGDSKATYAALASTLRGGLTYGLSGVPFWSHDVGGFHGTPTPDLYVRWAQFGALSPLVRFHGTTSRMPWDFPPEAERLAVAALELRYRLLPYIYSAAVDAARTGAPMMRALLVDSPDDPSAWAVEREYRLGRDLLVAPVFDPDGGRHVYLPAGEWVDWWTGTALAGARHVWVRPPADRIPLYVRRDALVPVATEPGHTVQDGPFRDVTVVSWGGGAGATTIRDTDGDTAVVAERDGGELRFRVDGPLAVRRFALARVDGAALPERVLVNGRVAELSTMDDWLVASESRLSP
jgi:alpha-D-xyloside xylohydrolase